MKQTAVEWLIQELRGTDDKGDFIFQGVINSELIEQAKEMEKQQIIESIDETNSKWRSQKAEIILTGNHYYNLKFNK